MNFQNIQILRAIAAFAVVVYHLQPMLGPDRPASLDTHIGAIGVDIFFIISGFVMYVSNQDMKKTIIGFFSGRLLRIVPMYWLATIFLVMVYLLGFNPNGLHYLEPLIVLKSLFFIPSTFPDGRQDLVLSLGWTLCFEFVFYFFFAISMVFRNSFKSLIFISIAFTSLTIFGQFWNSDLLLSFALNPILFEFILGGILAILTTGYLSRANVAPQYILWSAMVIFTIGIAGIFGSHFFFNLGDMLERTGPLAFQRVLILGGSASCIVGGAVLLELAGYSIKNKNLLTLGAASYSLYLFHPVFMQASTKLTKALSPFDNYSTLILMLSGALLLALMVSVSIHRFVEQLILSIGIRLIPYLK